jgi:hypothetical protein
VRQNCRKLALSFLLKVSDDNLMSVTRASGSVVMDAGLRETETEPISDRFAEVNARKVDK